MRFAPLSFFAVALAAPALVAAQAASSTSGAAAPQSTYIPTSGISTTCTGFLESLNSDDNLATCIAPLSNATDFYAQASRGTNPSQTALSQGLDKLCSDGDKCDVAAIRKRLFDFFDQCKPEIQQKNEAVLKLYDFLYLIIPFHQAVCTKGDDGKFCLLNTATSAATSAKTKRDVGTNDELLSGVKRSHEHAALHARQAAASVGSAASSTSASNNIAFLFLQPTAKKEVLCSSCTKNILAAYIAFETSIPYAIGLANSDQLKGQSDLYKASQKECGKDFSRQINVVAGTTDFAKVSGARGLPVASTVAGGLAAIAALGLAL